MGMFRKGREKKQRSEGIPLPKIKNEVDAFNETNVGGEETGVLKI